MDYQKADIKKLKNWFIRFAEGECNKVSPLYFYLSNKISEDEELLKIASFCKQRQPMPNLFLASIHYLLLTSPNQELSEYYPSISKNPKQNLPFSLFKKFCTDNRKAIIELEQTKIVQTNALNRCAYIMPILSSLFGDNPINIIDIGTSAGLTLNMDKYEYHYNDKWRTGKSLVKIRSEIRGGELPKFEQLIKINHKIGIDQNPLDLKLKKNANWLKALIWADRLERLAKMEQAIEIAQKEHIQFKKAQTVSEFKKIIQSQENNLPLVIYHTHTLYQFTQEEKTEFWQMIDDIGKKRNLTYLATENSKVLKKDYGINGVLVELTAYEDGNKTTRIVAKTDGHANWIKWI